jgi:hypothetical protein
MISRVAFIKIAALCLLAACLFQESAWGRATWQPVAPEDLAATACQSFPGSSAEYLLSTLTLEADGRDVWTDQYQQIKIYSAKGAQESGMLNIDYPADQRIWNPAARVTKPDGRSIEYDQKNFSEVVFSEAARRQWNRKTLAVPDLNADDIVDIQWSQSLPANVATYYLWYCQQAVPVRHYVFFGRSSNRDYRMLYFNVHHAEMHRVNGYQTRLDFRDLPPFSREPDMPPLQDARGCFMILFALQADSGDPMMQVHSGLGRRGGGRSLGRFSGDDQSDTDLWLDLSSRVAEDYRALTRPGSAVRAKAEELCAGAVDDQDKLNRLYDFCQQKVSNFDYFDSAELQKAKNRLQLQRWPQDPAETLDRRSGYSRQVNELFAALARAQGFDVRRAKSANRNATLDVRGAGGWLFVKDDLVAVRQGADWRLYCPGNYYLPAGMLDPSNEFATSLICDRDRLIFEQNPVAPAQKSSVARKGRFMLDANGNLEGEIEIALDGHSGIEKKMVWQNLQAADIDADYRATIASLLPSAEVSDLQWENLPGNQLPLIARYRISIPGYAERAGSAIILAPDVFVHGASVPFSADQREYPIFFDYARSEHDDIEITLPAGYAPEASDPPAAAGDRSGNISAQYRIGYRDKTHTVLYHRDFALGADSVIAYKAASYAALKSLLESINRSDQAAILLKPAAEMPKADSPQ